MSAPDLASVIREAEEALGTWVAGPSYLSHPDQRRLLAALRSLLAAAREAEKELGDAIAAAGIHADEHRKQRKRADAAESALAEERDKTQAARDMAEAWHIRAEAHHQAAENAGAALAEQRRRREEAERLVREMAESGVAYDEPRCAYVGLQIDRDTWRGVLAYASAPRPAPAQSTGDAVREAAERAAEDLGNVIYNIETGERRAAEEQAREIRAALLAALDSAPAGEGEKP